MLHNGRELMYIFYIKRFVIIYEENVNIKYDSSANLTSDTVATDMCCTVKPAS